MTGKVGSAATPRANGLSSTDSAHAYGLVAEQFRHPQLELEFGQTT